MSDGLIVFLAVLFVSLILLLIAFGLAIQAIEFPGGFKVSFHRPRPRPVVTSSAPVAQDQSLHTAPQHDAWLTVKGQGLFRHRLDQRQSTHIVRENDYRINLINGLVGSAGHAKIAFERGHYYVENFSSKGTRVNSGRGFISVSKHQLGNGNKIKIGKVELIFRERQH